MELKDMELKARSDGLTTFSHKMATLDLDQQMSLLDSLQELIYKGHREFTPMYPLVLVLVLRKQQVRASGIALPDSQQNKPMHEGIVLTTWDKKIVERGTVNKDGERLTRCEVLHSQLKPGDHVLFHHWAGMPIHGFDDQRFRVVREEAWHETQQGGIVGVLHYSDKENEPLEAIADELIGSDHAGYSLTEWALTKSKIRDRYIVIDKETSAVTLSGA
jgi:co-chaperonin GroES (HSP10)